MVSKNTKHDISHSTDLTIAAKRHEASPSEEHAAKEPIQQQIHRMFLLRVKLMHFVNSLHNYIVTRVGFLCFVFCSSGFVSELLVVGYLTHPFVHLFSDLTQHRLGISAPSAGGKRFRPAYKDPLQISVHYP